MFELRPYQLRDLENLRAASRDGARALLYVSPTGSGKTVCFSSIARKAAAASIRVAILVHRRELIRQTSQALTAMEIPHGIIAAGYPERRDVSIHVASVSTLARRLDRHWPFDLLIVDEAHHVVAGQYKIIIDNYPDAHLLGVTATPLRLDGVGLGKSAGGPFEQMIVGSSIRELTDAGWLASTDVYVPPLQLDLSTVPVRGGDYAAEALAQIMDRPVITGSAIEHYQRLCPSARAVVFCATVRHAHDVALQFQQAGIPGAGIDGSMEDWQRQELISRFESGDLKVLSSCELIGEGFDLPAIGAAILLRPTKSLTVHLQQVGRAMRPAPGKTRALILDHVGNTLRFGLPDSDRRWTLEGRRYDPSQRQAPDARVCAGCYFVFSATLESCPRCGLVVEKRLRVISEQPGELVRASEHPSVASPLSPLAAALESVADRWEHETRARLMRTARTKGYDKSWVERVLATMRSNRAKGASA